MKKEITAMLVMVALCVAVLASCTTTQSPDGSTSTAPNMALVTDIASVVAVTEPAIADAYSHYEAAKLAASTAKTQEQIQKSQANVATAQAVLTTLVNARKTLQTK